MKRPSVVRIVNHLYTIVYDESRIKDHFYENDEKVAGFCDKKLCEIVIDPTQAESKIRETTWHEIFHAINDWVMDGIESPKEEDYVHFGSPIWIATITDPLNKDVFEYILNVKFT